MIITNPCSLYKKKLEIGVGFFDYNTKKKSNIFLNPMEVSDIILTRASSISSEIFKLNPNINILLFNNGIPTHTIIPIDNLPKILKNEELFYKLSKHKKRKLAWIFCKGICSNRIEVISRLNETRNNEVVKETLKEMSELDKKLINAKEINELMGFEGNIAKKFYFCLSQFNKLFNVNRDRYNKDIVNVLMNLSHTILRNKIKYRLFLKGLNPSHSFLHGRESRCEDYLVWDFAELWIAYVDKLIFYSLEKGIIKEDSVIEGKLNEDSKNKIIRLVDERITNEMIDEKINDFINYLKGTGRFNWKTI
jgi:CRISPR-associated endonuclease Cas1